MFTNLTRALTVGLAAALFSVGLAATPSNAAPPSTPTSCSGVWVAVQFDDSSSVRLGCATEYSSGVELLESAGFAAVTSTSSYGLSLDQIDSKPTIGDPYYWYQAAAEISADGTLGSWVAGSGIGVDTPDRGKVSGFRLTSFAAAWPPPAPEITKVPVSTSAGPSSSPSASSSAAPTATPTATATAPTGSAGAKAAKWLAASVPTTWDSAADALNVGIGLATKECTYSTQLKAIRKYLLTQADDYSATSAYAAAKTAIFASAIGDDPTDFGGVNLAKRTLAGAGSNGKLGAADDFAFGQALAMIGLKRAGTAPSAKMVDYLVGLQLASGAWGYGTAADPDSTALALVALSDEVTSPTAETKAAIARASTWAAGAKKKPGYWTNYSPVDSTSLLASALKLNGADVADSASWLKTQQLRSGAFSNTANGKTANQLATATAMFLLTSTTYATVSAPLSTCTSPAPDDDETLASTGLASWPLALAGVGFVAIGGVMLLARRERYLPKHAGR